MMRRKTLGKVLLISGLIVGGITAACFVLLMMAAVGIGLSGGLKNGEEILFSFKLFGILSFLSMIVGSVLYFPTPKPGEEE